MNPLSPSPPNLSPFVFTISREWRVGPGHGEQAVAGGGRQLRPSQVSPPSPPPSLAAILKCPLCRRSCTTLSWSFRGFYEKVSWDPLLDATWLFPVDASVIG